MARKQRVPEPQWPSVWLTTFPRGLQLLLCLAMPGTAVSGALPHCPLLLPPGQPPPVDRLGTQTPVVDNGPTQEPPRHVAIKTQIHPNLQKLEIWLLGLALGPNSSAPQPRELVAAGSDSSDTGRACHCRRLY